VSAALSGSAGVERGYPLGIAAAATTATTAGTTPKRLFWRDGNQPRHPAMSRMMDGLDGPDQAVPARPSAVPRYCTLAQIWLSQGPRADSAPLS
jgi:hypothetical protein